MVRCPFGSVFRTINLASVFSREDSVSVDTSQSGSTYNKYGDYKPVDIKLTAQREQEHSKQSVDSDTNTAGSERGRGDSVTADGARSELSTGHGPASPVPVHSPSPDGRTAELQSVRSESATPTLDGRTRDTGTGGTAHGM